MVLFAGTPSAPTRFGTDVRDATDDRGLFLKVFSGEVIGTFNELNITMERTFERTITHGRSDQFPKTGKTEAEYHTPGQEMLGQDTDETENIITVDKTLVSHIGISDIDEAMSHFQVRAEYSRQLGEALALTTDKNAFRTIILTSRNETANGVNYGVPSGLQDQFPSGLELDDALIAGSLTATGGLAFWQAMRRISVYYRNVSMPTGMLSNWAALPPESFDALQWAVDSNGNYVLANRDFSPTADMNLGANEEVLRVGNLTVMRTVNLPQTDEASDTSVFSKYRGDFSAILGAAWHPRSIGTIKLRGMSTAMQRDERRGEDFIVSRMVVGHGPVQNAGAVSLLPTGVGTQAST